VKSRVWTFEGGSLATSSDQSVVVNYTKDGMFATNITSTFNDGTSEKRMFYVTVRPPVVANFSADKNYLKFGRSVVFSPQTQYLDFEENKTIGIENSIGYTTPYQWEFEGGNPATSTAMNPSVLYSNIGKYKVKLTVTRNVPKNSIVVVKEGFINVLENDVISPSSTLLALVGSQIYLDFGEDMAALPADVKSSFMLLVNGNSVDFSIELKTARRIILTPNSPITEGQSINVKYTPGTVKSVANKILAPQDLIINNNLVNLLSANSDFEQGNLTNWTARWDNPADATWNVLNTAPNSGTYCLRFNPLASGRHRLNITLKPGLVLLNKKYRLQFAAKAPESGWTGGFATVWKAGANPYIETNQSWWANGANSSWKTNSFDLSFTEAGWAGADQLNVCFNTEANKTERYLDDVKFYEIFE
jgi:PKD repeat protein